MSKKRKQKTRKWKNEKRKREEKERGRTHTHTHTMKIKKYIQIFEEIFEREKCLQKKRKRQKKRRKIHVYNVLYKIPVLDNNSFTHSNISGIRLNKIPA